MAYGELYRFLIGVMNLFIVDIILIDGFTDWASRSGVGKVRVGRGCDRGLLAE